jgi:transcriptional regulator with XRE-family HTH domain
MKKRRVGSEKIATPADRFRIVLKIFFAGSQSAMARKLGCSQPMISRVVAGEKEPGPRLLMALASCPGVSRRWVLTGIGKPLAPLGREATEGDAALRIARQFVLGPLGAHRDQLSDAYLPVLHRDYSPSRYWFILDDDRQAKHGLLRGDAILVETNGSWLVNPLLLRGKWCVLLPSDDAEPHLRRIGDDESPEIESIDSPFPVMSFAKFRRFAPDRAPMKAEQRRSRTQGKPGVGPSNTAEQPRRSNDPKLESTAGRIITGEFRAGGEGAEVAWDLVVGVVVLAQRRWPWD